MAEAGFYAISSVGIGLGLGATGTREVRLQGLLKMNEADFAYTVANEYICGRLAMSMGLPVPPGTIAQLDDGQMGYAMMRFGLSGEAPPPADPAQMWSARPGLCGRIAIFDDWIINADRHVFNFAFVPGAPTPHASVFDHGHALMGITAGGAKQYLETHRTHAVWGPALPPVIDDPAVLLRAVELARACPDELVYEACETPYRLGLIDREEFKTAADVLVERKDLLLHHVQTSHSSFPNISDADWGAAH